MARRDEQKPDLIKWLTERLERTPLLAIRFSFPKTFTSPFGYLGVLTAITFLILGITGGILALYYQPGYLVEVETDPTTGEIRIGEITNYSYESIKIIDEEVAFGVMLRNLHYHASNAMIFLALMHLFYQYFSGRYKIKNELLWVTGILLGFLAIIEAYTGYNLINNTRALLAINIGVALGAVSPGAIELELVPIVFGRSLNDIMMRFYALHVFIIPLIMLALITIHFPRNLVFDVPTVFAITGAIFVVSGMFPVEVGLPAEETLLGRSTIEVPEWYLTSIYAFLRTGLERFLAGALLPILFILFFLLIPFVDRSRKLSWKDRPFFTAAGITAIGQIIISTVWGFYVVPPAPELTFFDRIFIDPLAFNLAMTVPAVGSFVFVYSFMRRPKQVKPRRVKPITLRVPYSWAVAIMYVLLGLLIVVNFVAYLAILQGTRESVLTATTAIGIGFILFGAVYHVYRYGQQIAAK